ncbi:hypothetical protein AGQ63_23760 [Salmonella enterica subsp. enterica]|nr:hypothetical protein AGQ63_23760 [Salmonella enterica subsp. enterica]
MTQCVEFEVNCAISDNLQLIFGATRYVSEYNEGNAVNPNPLRTSVKFFTRYRLPLIPALTDGGGENRQHRVFIVSTTLYGTFGVKQGPFPGLDLFTGYLVT